MTGSGFHYRFDSVVFAGGGSRCLWQVGFWEEVFRERKLFPRQIAAVSAGAAMSCIVLSGKIKEAMERFKEATRRNRRNVYPANLFNSNPVFPHYGMYRATILDAVDAETLRLIREGPDIQVLLSRPPRWMGPRTATLAGILGYLLERKLRDPVHPSFGRRMGFAPQVVSVRECETPSELAGLILASSCTPPFTPILSWKGKPVLDGGLVDNVPVSALDGRQGDTLVLLTRQYQAGKIPLVPGRVYVQPSRPISVSKWDYTNPGGLQEAYDLGQADGVRFVKAQSGHE